MFEKSNKHLLDSLLQQKKMHRSEWVAMLTSLCDEEKKYLHEKAREIAVSNFGKGIYVRALLEISSYCRNNCNYCGLRCSNTNARRYRLSKEKILECCREAADSGFNTFVLQGGEDIKQNADWLVDVVSSIRNEFPNKAITLSVGEHPAANYEKFRKAGADRYLLRHETRNDEHYSMLHPENMSGVHRRECLFTLKRLGFQTGSGMMIGAPYQTAEHLAEDILFLEELQPEMIGIGPFIPADNTPFAGFNAGTSEETILLISILRIRFPKALIPATTALATIDELGTEKAIMAGANVIMPNMSPVGVRSKYSIYNNKKSYGTESAQQMKLIENKVSAIGYKIDYSRGDYNAQ